VEQDQREFAEFYAAAWGDCLRIVMVSVLTGRWPRTWWRTPSPKPGAGQPAVHRQQPWAPMIFGKFSSRVTPRAGSRALLSAG